MLRFQFDERKGVEALAHVATVWPGVTAFFASKVLFYAEKFHLNRYGRPIVADTFIAMANGPVPSTIYDFIEGRLNQAEDPESITSTLSIKRDGYSKITALRAADLDVLSETDIECLNDAVALCQPYEKHPRGFTSLSDRTHQEKAWSSAPANGPMDYEAMLDDGPARDQLLEEAREFAAYGVM